MLEKFENFIEFVFNSMSRKRIIILVTISFFFFVCQSKIETFIENYLLIDKEFSNFCFDSILSFLSVYFSIYLIFKILRRKYIPSNNEVILCLVFISFYFYYDRKSSGLNWEFTRFYIFNCEVKYLFIVLLPALAFIGSIILQFFYNSFFVLQKPLINKYMDDAPIESIENDELDYKAIVDKLTEVLKSQSCQNSFTIGLVGPWGNGKSSIIKMVISVLKPKLSFFNSIIARLKSKDEIIIINFLPYLNHKDEDIISEFFTSLSKELSRYNGKLSDQILEYSKRLTNVYKENKIIELFENLPYKSTETPSKNLYDEINSRIKEVGKKIIVFIDDLDRLNDHEILQVLKLIRNTADFNNIIFVVAMDKDYVINRLRANNQVLDSRFIDKFFQLEIYLPELETKLLRDYFIKELLKSKLANNTSFQIKLALAMRNDYNLFDLYIKNFRDVKRIINQIVFEYPLFEDELDLKDFMNFTYFKLKFPKLIKVLNDNRNTILKIDNTGQFYQLPLTESSMLIKSSKGTDYQKDEVIVVDKFQSIINYVIYEQLNVGDLSVKDFLSIEKEDLNLFLKTLASLFGKENSIENTYSIKFENNFRKLMQQKFRATDLLESEFRALFERSIKLDKESSTSYELPLEQIDNLNNNNKLNELLRRFEYFNASDINNLNWTILILGILFEKRAQYKLEEKEILNLLNLFVERQISVNINSEVVGEWLVKNLFDNILSTENKLSLYGQIWHNKKNWGIESNKFSKLILESFVKLISDLKEKEYSIDDISLYTSYHIAKGVDNIGASVREAFINFWDPDNINILCVHMTEVSNFSGVSFHLSAMCEDVFGSYANFIDFVEKLRNSKNSTVIMEFLMLFRLCSITNYTKNIVFEFKFNSLMKEKIKVEKDNITRLRYDNSDYVQVIFESNDDKIMNEIVRDKRLTSRYEMYLFTFESKWYLLINFEVKTHKEEVRQIFPKIIVENIIPKISWKDSKFTLDTILNKKDFITSGDKYIKVYSVQPEIK
jgi:hypothetical protein